MDIRLESQRRMCRELSTDRPPEYKCVIIIHHERLHHAQESHHNSASASLCFCPQIRFCFLHSKQYAPRRYSDVKSVTKTHIDLLLEQKIHAFERDLLQWRGRFLHDKKLLQQWQRCTRSGLRTWRWYDVLSLGSWWWLNLKPRTTNCWHEFQIYKLWTIELDFSINNWCANSSSSPPPPSLIPPSSLSPSLSPSSSPLPPPPPPVPPPSPSHLPPPFSLWHFVTIWRQVVLLTIHVWYEDDTCLIWAHYILFRAYIVLMKHNQISSTAAVAKAVTTTMTRCCLWWFDQSLLCWERLWWIRDEYDDDCDDHR